MTIILNCWWQILVAAAAYFALGAFWFNQRVFGTIWMTAHGLSKSDDRVKSANMGLIFTLSYVFSAVVTAVICWICVVSCGGEVCGPETMWACVRTGIIIGVVMSCAIAITYLFLMKPINAYLTDCGYHLSGCLLSALMMHLLGCC